MNDRDDDVISMVNNKKYEDDTAYFDIVNDNAKQADKAIQDEERLNAYFAATERAVQDSIGRADVRADRHRYIKERAEELRRKRNAQIIALLLAGATLVGGMVYVGGKISTQIDISKATNIAVENVRQELLIDGYATLDYEKNNLNDEGPYTVKNNTVEDYARLSVQDVEDVYAYSKVLPEKEFEDFIKSMQYTTPDGTFNYVSFEQYLSVNGFPSEKEFENKAQAILLEMYRNGNLVSIHDAVENTKGGRKQ